MCVVGGWVEVVCVVGRLRCWVVVGGGGVEGGPGGGEAGVRLRLEEREPRREVRAGPTKRHRPPRLRLLHCTIRAAPHVKTPAAPPLLLQRTRACWPRSRCALIRIWYTTALPATPSSAIHSSTSQAGSSRSAATSAETSALRGRRTEEEKGWEVRGWSHEETAWQSLLLAAFHGRACNRSVPPPPPQQTHRYVKLLRGRPSRCMRAYASNACSHCPACSAEKVKAGETKAEG